jgi:hypothetical protein
MPAPTDAEELRDKQAETIAAAAATAETPPDDDDEHDDDEHDDDEDPDAEPELAAPVELPAKSIEKQAREFGRLVDGFEAGLCELLEVDGPLVQVPMEGAIGFMLPGALELRAHDKFRRCAVCNGHGQVLTGSLADSQQTADCPRCGGRGYLERLEQQAPPAEGEPPAVNGTVDDDAAFGVPKWAGDPNIRPA